MAIRTTSAAVIEILGTTPNGDYDGCRNLTPFIRSASYIVDDLVSGGWSHGSQRAIDIESWVAAHLYTLADRLLKSKNTGSSGGTFVMGKNETPYLDGANALDPTGELAAILSGQNASMDWLGTIYPDQDTYEDRN